MIPSSGVSRGPFLRSAYNYDRDEASYVSGLECGPSLTKQSFKEDCDINVIVRRFGLTGKMPENLRLPQYGDFADVVDFASAMNAVRLAEEEFMQIPAHVRERFSNSPQKLLEFCSDPANRDEGVKLGLFNPQEEQVAPPEASQAVVPPKP